MSPPHSSGSSNTNSSSDRGFDSSCTGSVHNNGSSYGRDEQQLSRRRKLPLLRASSLSSSLLPLLCLAVLFCLAVPASALRDHLVVDNDDRSSYVIQTFGYAAGGKINIILESFTIHDRSPSANATHSEVALVLERGSDDAVLRTDTLEAGQCLHKAPSYDDDVILMLLPR